MKLSTDVFFFNLQATEDYNEQVTASRPRSRPPTDKPKTNPAEELKVEELEERIAPMKIPQVTTSGAAYRRVPDLPARSGASRARGSTHFRNGIPRPIIVACPTF